MHRLRAGNGFAQLLGPHLGGGVAALALRFVARGLGPRAVRSVDLPDVDLCVGDGHACAAGTRILFSCRRYGSVTEAGHFPVAEA